MARTTWLLIGLALCLAGCRAPRNQARLDALPGGDVEPAPVAESESTVAASLAAGESALREGRLPEARMHLDAVIEQSPQHARAHHLAAVVADLQHRFDDAERHYHAALQSDPRNPDLLGDLGYSYYLQQRDDQAQQYLSQALNVDAGHTTAKKNLALVAARQGNAAQARQLLAEIMPPGDVDQLLAQIAPPSSNALHPQTASHVDSPAWAHAPETPDMPAMNAVPHAQPRVQTDAPNRMSSSGIVDVSHTEPADVAPAVPDQTPPIGGAPLTSQQPPNSGPAPSHPNPLAVRDWPPASWPGAQSTTPSTQHQSAPASGESLEQNDELAMDNPWQTEAVAETTRDTALDPLQSYHEYRRRNDPEYARLTEGSPGPADTEPWRP